MPLAGPTFNCDTAEVYGIIKQFISEGPSRSFAIPFNNEANGREAWLGLRNHFAVAFREGNVEEACALLDKLSL